MSYTGNPKKTKEIEDTTSSIYTQDHLAQMKRLYATLSHVNQTIVRVKQHHELYQAICDIAVLYGEFVLAWISLLDEGTGEVHPLVANGLDMARWPFPPVNIRQDRLKNGLIATAIRTSRVVTSENLQSDKRTGDLHGQLRKHGYHSLAAVPFHLKGQIVGVLVLISRREGLFKDEDELLLLEEIGMDISFALDKLENEKTMRQWVDAFENCAEGIALCNPSTNKIITCNPAFAQMQGRTIQEISSMPILDLYIPKDHDLVKKYIAESDRAGHVRFEAQMLRKDGNEYPVQMDLVSVRDENGDLMYRVATQQNITERKRAADALRQSEERFRNTLDNMLEGCQIIGYDWRYLYINDAAARQGHSKPEELLHRTMMEMYPGIENTELFTALRDCMENRVARQMENAFTYPDGDIRWFELSIQLAPDGIFILSIDITERRLVELALRASEENYRSLVENSESAIAVLNRNGQLLYANSWAIKIWNDPHIIGKTVSDIYPREYANRYLAAIRKVIDTQTSLIDEVESLIKDRLMWFHLSMSPLKNPDGVVDKLLLNAWDITARKQAEEQLQTSERNLKLFVESSPAAIAMLDRDMNYIVASHRYLTDYRLADQDITGRSHYEVFPEIPERWKEIHRRCLAGAIEKADEDPFPRADGTLDWVRWEIHPWYEKTGEIGGIILFSEVLTTQKHAEKTILESERQMRALVTSLDDVVIEIDAQGTYLNIWTSHETLLIRPETQLLGRHIFDNFSEELGQLIANAVKRVLSNGSPETIEYPLKVIGGQRWFMARISPIFNQDESYRTVSMLVRDITTRKQAEREIQKRTEELTLMNVLNNAANRGEDLAGITAVFAREAYKIFNCKSVAVYLLSLDAQHIEFLSNTLPPELIVKIEKHIGGVIPNPRIPMREDGYINQLLANERGTLTTDPEMIQQWIEEFTEAAFSPPAFPSEIGKIVRQFYQALDIHSTISIPLLSSGRAIGLLDMASQGHFSLEDLQRVRTIGHQMTAVLLRKQAEEHIQIHLKRMNALNEIDRAITSSLDMHQSLELLLKQVLSQLGVDAAMVLLLNTHDQTLEYMAGKGFRNLAFRQSQLALGEGFAGRVGLQRKILHIPDLADVNGQFKRAELLKDEGFVEYFGIPLVAKGILKGVLEIFHRTHLSPDLEWVNYLETLAGQAAIAVDNAQLFKSVQQSNLELIAAYDATITGWSLAMDLRDKETEGHTQRVTDLTLKLAERMGIGEPDLTHIRRGALLHDIGKLGVPDQILLKPGKLSKKEWAVMCQHPTYALNMLLPITYLQPALDIPYCHHEKWDGSGYPRGLKGENIPFPARIFAIVDVWDALRSDRPYRASWSTEQTRKYIIEQSGKHFDPQVVEAFLSMIEEE